MEPLTLEALEQRPELLQGLLLRARRERSAAVYRLIILPVKRLFSPVELGACSKTASSKASASSSPAAEPV